VLRGSDHDDVNGEREHQNQRIADEPCRSGERDELARAEPVVTA
jgi:hypothetical protein